MFCRNCGQENKEGARFCKGCGRAIQGISGSLQETFEVNWQLKMQRITGIINTIAGAILLLIGLVDAEWDWGWISLISGSGIMVMGILQLMRKRQKTVGIIGIVFGALSILFGMICDLDYDWGYIGILIGSVLLVTGILSVLKKSIKVIGIVEIVLSGVLLLFALACIEFDWGLIGLVAGVPSLVSGILNLVNLKHINEQF